MLLFLFLSSIVLLVFLVSMWKARSRMEFLLSTAHRDFLRSIKVNGPDKLPKYYVLMGAVEAMHSIEINGEVKEYSAIFRDVETLSKLGDQELSQLSKKFRASRLRVLYIAPVVIVSLILVVTSA